MRQVKKGRRIDPAAFAAVLPGKKREIERKGVSAPRLMTARERGESGIKTGRRTDLGRRRWDDGRGFDNEIHLKIEKKYKYVICRPFAVFLLQNFGCGESRTLANAQRAGTGQPSLDLKQRRPYTLLLLYKRTDS